MHPFVDYGGSFRTTNCDCGVFSHYALGIGNGNEEAILLWTTKAFSHYELVLRWSFSHYPLLLGIEMRDTILHGLRIGSATSLRTIVWDCYVSSHNEP